MEYETYEDMQDTCEDQDHEYSKCQRCHAFIHLYDGWVHVHKEDGGIKHIFLCVYCNEIMKGGD